MSCKHCGGEVGKFSCGCGVTLAPPKKEWEVVALEFAAALQAKEKEIEGLREIKEKWDCFQRSKEANGPCPWHEHENGWIKELKAELSQARTLVQKLQTERASFEALCRQMAEALEATRLAWSFVASPSGNYGFKKATEALESYRTLFPEPKPEGKPCGCGAPWNWSSGIVHRTDGPCYFREAGEANP